MERKKIVLAYPNFRWMEYDIFTLWDLNPATLCLLVSMIKDIIDIKIIDAQFYNLSLEEFKNEIRKYQPDYVGISIMTSEYGDVLDIAAKAVKEVNRNIIVLAGGVHVTINFADIMKNKNIDYCIRGEGEYVLRDLIQYLYGKGNLPDKGVIYRKDGNVITQEQAMVEDISKLPWPAYGFVDFNAYLNKTGRFGPTRPPALPVFRTVPTRGCPFRCSFCQSGMLSGKKVRTRDPEDVMNELLFLKEEYGIKSIIFENDNLLMGGSNSFAKKLFTLMIKKQLDLKWICPGTALFLLNDEILDLMRDSGCVGVNVAIESGNERVLKEIVNKPIKNLKMVPKIIEKIKSRGMYCLANFIIGFPGETWDEIRETISFAETCGADYVKIYVAVPLYGTKLYKMALESGKLECDSKNPKVNWRYGQISTDEWTAKDVSILRAYEWDRINFSKERIRRTAELWGMTIEELKEIRKLTRDKLIF